MIARIPKDPVMLLSYINTLLRDYYSDLDALENGLGLNINDIKEKLAAIDYEYDAGRNQFV